MASLFVIQGRDQGSRFQLEDAVHSIGRTHTHSVRLHDTEVSRNHAELIRKVYFPRLIIPLSSIGAGLVDLLISTGILLLMMLWYGVGWSWNLLNLMAVPLILGTGVDYGIFMQLALRRHQL